jgi:hypothetical protein
MFASVRCRFSTRAVDRGATERDFYRQVYIPPILIRTSYISETIQPDFLGVDRAFLGIRPFRVKLFSYLIHVNIPPKGPITETTEPNGLDMLIPTCLLFNCIIGWRLPVILFIPYPVKIAEFFCLSKIPKRCPQVEITNIHAYAATCEAMHEIKVFTR